MDIRDPKFNEVRQDGRKGCEMVFNPEENKSTLEPVFQVGNAKPATGHEAFDVRICPKCGDTSDADHREMCTAETPPGNTSIKFDNLSIKRISNGFILSWAEWEDTGTHQEYVTDKHALMQWIKENL